MSGVVVRGMSPTVQATGRTLKIPLPARNVDDLIVLYTTCVTALGDGSTPALPAGFKVLYTEGTATGWVVVAWKRVGPNEPDVVMTMPASIPFGGWWGHVEVYGGVDYRDSGWLDIPGTAGKYATLTRSALATPTLLSFSVRVSFDALGVVNWVSGWANGDVGFGLNASDKPVIFATNTVGGIIGNAPATVPIVGLVPNQKVWLIGNLDTTTASCSYAYSFDDVEHVESAQITILGTPVVGTNAGTTMRVTNSGTAFVGARDAATTPSKKHIYSYVENTNGVDRANFTLSDPNPTGFALVGGATVYRPTLGNSSPIESFDVRTAPLDPANIYIPGRFVWGPNRLAVHVWTGQNTTGQVLNPITGPEGWTAYLDRFTSFADRFAKDVTRSKVVSATFSDVVLPGTNTTYSFGYYTIVIRPLVAPARPSTSPQPPRLQLGCAESYTVWITDQTYDTGIDVVRWSSLQYERALDQISTASITLPSDLGGVNCLAKDGGLVPWKYGIRIERNDQLAWEGPVVTVGRRGKNIQIGCADVLSRYQKRFAVRDAPVDYANVDAGTIFADIINIHARSSLDQWQISAPYVTTGVAVTRTLKPREFKYAWDLLSELLNASLDAYIMNGVLYVWEPDVGWQYQADIQRTLAGPYNDGYEFVYGTFTEEAFSVRPDWTIDGAGQANFNAVPSADTGEMGFRTYESAEVAASQDIYGLLDNVDPDPVDIPEDAPAELVAQILRSRADSINELRAYPPITVDGGVLSQAAPVDMDNLRPGALWKLDVFDDGYPQLLSLCRLRRVSVSVTRANEGIIETITPTLQPPGSEGTP